MNVQYRPRSLVAERAVRFLRRRGTPANSRTLAREVLALTHNDEATATKVLEAAFAGDRRLARGDDGWNLTDVDRDGAPSERPQGQPARALMFVDGEPRKAGHPFKLNAVAVLRLEDEEIVAACGGDTLSGSQGSRLRRTIVETLEGAVPVIHDQPGALKALEDWLQEPLDAPVSLRHLARARLGLPANHNLETLAARLGMIWRDSEDPLELADVLDACLRQLLREGETLLDLRTDPAHGTQIDWSRFAFSKDDLRAIPDEPGTYQFFDADDGLVYVGKSRNLRQRVASYFREGVRRSPRIQRLLDVVYRIEYKTTGSDLEATLEEAALIRDRKPLANVQRNVDPSRGRASRLRSILILEPAAPPSVLRAYLIRDGRLLDKVAIGPRGGGLTRIERALENHFFSSADGPTPVAGPDLDVEVVVRWLAANRDRAVAFDPTDLQNAKEVIDRLHWFLDQGTPFDPDGSPVFHR